MVQPSAKATKITNNGAHPSRFVNIFSYFETDDVHGIVVGDDTHQNAMFVSNRKGEQVIARNGFAISSWSSVALALTTSRVIRSLMALVISAKISSRSDTTPS